MLQEDEHTSARFNAMKIAERAEISQVSSKRPIVAYGAYPLLRLLLPTVTFRRNTGGGEQKVEATAGHIRCALPSCPGHSSAFVTGDTPAPTPITNRTNRAASSRSRAGGDVQSMEESQTQQNRSLVAYRKCFSNTHVLCMPNTRSCHTGAAQCLA